MTNAEARLVGSAIALPAGGIMANSDRINVNVGIIIEAHPADRSAGPPVCVRSRLASMTPPPAYITRATSMQGSPC